MTEEKIPSMEDIDNEDFDLDETEDSAPSEEEPQEPEQAAEPEPEVEEPEVEEPKRDRVQERINQLTAKYREEERKRQELEQRLNQIEKPKVDAPTPPDPNEFYDDSEYQQALIKYSEDLIDYKVVQRTQELVNQQRQAVAEQQRQAKNEAYAQKVEQAKIPEYEKALQDLILYSPLRPELVDVIQEDDNGPQLVHYLGTHLDVADKISNIKNPAIAALELGKISAGLKRKPEKQKTKATKPIEPEARSGGKLSRSLEERVDKGDTPSMDEIWKMD